MNRESIVSIPFQKICAENHQFGRTCREDPIIFCLGVFLQHQLRIVFDDGRQIRGILTSVSAEFIGIDGEMYRLSECSRWLFGCQVGVAVGLDVELIRIIPSRYYGIDHRESIYVNLDNQRFVNRECFSFSTDQSEDIQDAREYPILYGLNGEAADIYSVGASITKIHFGSLEKYFKNVGAGLIMPYQDNGLISAPSLRFAAEDLINIMPKELDTFSFHYDVSYTIGFLVDGSPKAVNIYKLRDVPLQRDDSDDPLQPLYDSMEEAVRQWNAATEILALESLSGDGRYGLLFFYKSDFSFIKLYCLYKSKIYGELTSGEQRRAQLAIIPQTEENSFLKEALNTIDYVYLVSFDSVNHVKICAVYEKKEIWMLQVEGEHLLIVRAPWEREQGESEFFEKPREALFEQETDYGEVFVSSLPDTVKQGEVYAILHYYPRSNQMIYFYSIYDPKIKNEQARQCTVARVESDSVQFFRDGEEDSVEPAALIINTYKNLYIVRIMLEERSEVQGAPFVTGAVNIVRVIPRENCQRLEIEGNFMRIYGTENEGIIQSGILLENQGLPAFIEGETLLVMDKSGQHTVTFHDADPFRPNEQDTIYRFGLLTALFKEVDGATLTGGCLNHCIYFDIANMGEQVRNIIQTTPKRILLQYACIDGKVRVDRVLPESVWDIPWQKGTVTDCTNSVAELLIVVDNEINHYQSIATDGYVNTAVRNGTLINQSVYLKKIVCPDWQDGEVPQLMEIAPLIHCEWEKAVVSYDDNQKQYYAYRYNLTTNTLGTIRRVLYGSEGGLADAIGQREEILFQPYGDNGLELIAVLPMEGDERPSDMRMPFNLPEVQRKILPKPSIMDHQQAQKTVMGVFMLRNVDSNRRYLELLSVADMVTPQSVDSQNSFALKGIFLSENSEDLAIAAKLLENPAVRTRARSFIQDTFPLNTHGFLRRAMRIRVAEVVQSGNYLVGEFIAYMLAIIDSDTTPEQRARDLYVYFMPVFRQRYNVQERTLFDIRKPSFASEKDIREQEFVAKLREWFCTDSFVPDVSALLAQIVALDDVSFEYLFAITSDAFSRKIREVLLLGCGTIDGAQGMDGLLAALRGKRGKYFERKKDCLHLLTEFSKTDVDSKICIYMAERQHEMFDAFLPLLDNDDQENVRELLKNCRNVKSSVGERYAEKMRLLEEAQKNISRQRLLVFQQPTLVMVELFQNTGLLERIHGEIIQAINSLCKNENSLPAVRCICNYPILVPNQSNFALLLENGKEGDEAHRSIQNPTVSLTSKGGISEDGIEHELKLNKSELMSGSQETIIVKITLEDVDVGTIIHIGYTVTYQYLDNVSFDDSHTKMIPFWKTSVVEGDVMLHVEEVPDSLRKNKQNTQNPYRNMVNCALNADNRMYFGREDERDELMEYLKDGREYLVSGKTVIVYGQKQCGKTSFINRIWKELEGDSKVFVLYYDDIFNNICNSSVNALAAFMQRFYGDLLEKLMKKLRQSADMDLLDIAERFDSCFQPLMDDLLHEHLDEKTKLFFHLIRELQKRSVDQYKIVLIMDEFTRLCNVIRNYRDSYPEYITIPEFLRSFSQLGFIQIVVGHDSMMRTLEDLNILNRTAQTAKVMQISALKDEDARKMIEEPMEDIFGFNIYATESGKMAVKRLMVLSGCGPNYLAYLCDKMFRYYQTEGKPQVNEQDVNRMLDEFVAVDLTENYKILFDPLLTEDYDTGEMREDIYRYLTNIAQLTYDRSGYKCAIDTPCKGIREERTKTIRNMLISRKVLSAKNGMIWINVGLFREHVRMFYGK